MNRHDLDHSTSPVVTSRADRKRLERALRADMARGFTKFESAPASLYPSAPKGVTSVHRNAMYTVLYRPLEDTAWGAVVHLMVIRHDKRMPESWSDLQRIKDELVGKYCVGVQVFPAADDLVDQANAAHLWVARDPRFRLPFNLKDW